MILDTFISFPAATGGGSGGTTGLAHKWWRVYFNANSSAGTLRYGEIQADQSYGTAPASSEMRATAFSSMGDPWTDPSSAGGDDGPHYAGDAFDSIFTTYWGSDSPSDAFIGFELSTAWVLNNFYFYGVGNDGDPDRPSDEMSAQVTIQSSDSGTEGTWVDEWTGTVSPAPAVGASVTVGR